MFALGVTRSMVKLSHGVRHSVCLPYCETGVVSTLFSSLTIFACSKRCIVEFGVYPLSHEEVLRKYQDSNYSVHENYGAFVRRIVSQLDTVESMFGSWKQGKWLFRIPVLLPPHEKELLSQTLRVLREKIEHYSKVRETAYQDVQIIADALGIRGTSRSDLSLLPRASIQEHIANLRWNGEIDKARNVRNAWHRLEECGADDAMLVDRMCCIYGLLKINTFERAFSNYLRVDDSTGQAFLDTTDSLREVGATILTNAPHIDVYYAFLGFDSENFVTALGKYILDALEEKHQVHIDRSNLSKILQDSSEPIHVLFRANDNSEYLVATKNSGIAEYVHCVRLPPLNSEGQVIITLIIVAKENPYERQVQLPQDRQLEGIARRMAFVLGVQIDNVRVRNLFLPPGYMDHVSLEGVDRMLEYVSKKHKPFKGQISRDLLPEHADYEHQRKNLPQDEWMTL